MKKSLVLCILLGTLAACNKDFLDRKPLGSASVASLFQDEDGLKLAINGVHSALVGPNLWWEGNFYYMTPHNDGITEDAVIQFEHEGWFQPWANGSITPTTRWIDAKWNIGFKGIARANAVLANIDGIAMTEQQRDKYKAEVRFLRGFIYSELVKYFGGVPLILKPVLPAEAIVPRNTKEEVLAAVMEDLDFAIANLDVAPRNNERGRPTKTAALGIKTRVLLHQGNWAGAAAAAHAIIDLEPSGAVGLSTNYESLFNARGEDDKEIIFAYQHIGPTANSSDVGQGSILAKLYGPKLVDRGNGWGSIYYQEAMFDAFYMKDGLPVTSSPLYDPANPYANRDPRLYWSFLIPGISTWNGNPYTAVNYNGQIPELPINTRKWVSDIDTDSQAGNTDFIIVRYADILLMYAEAKNEVSGPDASVYTAINKVRRRAQMPDVTPGLSKEAMRQVIWHERKVELSQEGLRFHDLVRWGIAKEKINSNKRQQRNWQDYNAILPIPQTEMNVNRKLVQNPGYSN